MVVVVVFMLQICCFPRAVNQYAVVNDCIFARVDADKIIDMSVDVGYGFIGGDGAGVLAPLHNVFNKVLAV